MLNKYVYSYTNTSFMLPPPLNTLPIQTLPHLSRVNVFLKAAFADLNLFHINKKSLLNSEREKEAQSVQHCVVVVLVGPISSVRQGAGCWKASCGSDGAAT